MNTAGELIIVPPVGGYSGNREAKLDKMFSSSIIFILPNSAGCSPDAAWVRSDRWLALTSEQRQKFSLFQYLTF